MAIKACWFCDHFRFHNGEPDLSEVTLGSDFSISCRKNKWDFDAEFDSQEKFGQVLSSAETCPDFLDRIPPTPPLPHPKYDDVF